ncbi:hypothetical protein [Thermoactinomyces sp. DSM 45892]|uniref:hypothetical protein n=1 Tax=Thermoactinomyces sp. DSM 45892 TaxID=1882753 RepID=UPI00089CF688|nr:hypothetical protein [Thermoactinomyces sp. DSM 45892]SDY39399.1 hypothetical protein SAMN05444416_104136 [Thermoactinomyces sp. DSM 45892]
MNHYNYLVHREKLWYRLGPFRLEKGISKQMPRILLMLECGIFLSSFIPYTPFWLVEKYIPLGVVVNLVALPLIGAYWLSHKKKKPQKKILSGHHSRHSTMDQPVSQPTTFSFGKGYTICIQSRVQKVPSGSSYFSRALLREEKVR